MAVQSSTSSMLRQAREEIISHSLDRISGLGIDGIQTSFDKLESIMDRFRNTTKGPSNDNDNQREEALSELNRAINFTLPFLESQTISSLTNIRTIYSRVITLYEGELQTSGSLPEKSIEATSALTQVSQETGSVKVNPQQQRQPLKPLKDNPLNQTHPIGFSFNVSPSHPYYAAHPTWCDRVSENSFDNEDAIVASYKAKMGIPKTEEMLTPFEQKRFQGIDKALNFILKELKKEKPDLQTIEFQIGEVYENIYQLLVIPINDIQQCLKPSPFTFILNQQEFRQGLEALLPTPKDKLAREILDETLNAMSEGTIDRKSSQLLTRYPAHQALIDDLTRAVHVLMKKAQEKILADIDNYKERNDDVKFCFNALFARQGHLIHKYDEMLHGRYSSLEEIPRGIPSNRIHCASYIPAITGLLRACEAFLSSPDKTEKEYIALSEGFDSYLQQRNLAQVFQDKVFRLIQFLERVKSVLQWPQEYELSDGEMHYLRQKVYFLMFISNKQLGTEPAVPYAYLTINEEKIKEESLKLKNKATPTGKKIEACRTLYHARIPWKALRAIGTLCHGSGGVSEAALAQNQQLLQDSFGDFVQDLPRVQRSIEELIDFEVAACSSSPNLTPPSPLPIGCYANIQLIGNLTESKRTVSAVVDLLDRWTNLRLTTDELAQPKAKFAHLRTLQILGENVKILRDSGVLGDDEAWKFLEEMRDLLSHSERISVFKRLQILLNEPRHQRLFTLLREDFQMLREYFSGRMKLLEKATTWAHTKRIQQEAENSSVELTCIGVQELCVFLDDKIPSDIQDKLRQSLLQRAAQERRKKIFQIKKDLLASQFNPSDIGSLPLTKVQRGDLEEAIKVISSPQAAQNSHRSVQPKLRATTLKNIQELKKDQRLTAQLDQLTEAEKLISSDEHLDKIPSVKQLLEAIMSSWTQGRKPPLLVAAVGNLKKMTESIDEYVNEKKESLSALVESISTYEESSIEETCNGLIRQMQLRPMNKDDLMLQIAQLGIVAENDRKIWIDAQLMCIKKKKVSAPAEDPHKNEKTRKKAIGCINAINQRIHNLDKLLSIKDKGDVTRALHGDPMLRLACQYLLADFKDSASTLELCLDTLSRFLNVDREFIKEIKNDLQQAMEKRDDLAHNHEVTEPGSTTSAGYVFHEGIYISQLLLNFSLRDRPHMVVNSIDRKLAKLRHILETAVV